MIKRIDPRECQNSIKEVNDFHYLETINITPFTNKSIKKLVHANVFPSDFYRFKKDNFTHASNK